MALPAKTETNYYYLQPEGFDFAQATKSKSAEEGSKIVYREIEGVKTPYHVFLYKSVIGTLKSIKFEEREHNNKKFTQLQIVLQDLNDTYIISVAKNSSYVRSIAKFISGLKIGEIYTVKCWKTSKSAQFPYPTSGFTFYNAKGEKVEGKFEFEKKENRDNLLETMVKFLASRDYEFAEVKKPKEGAKNYDDLLKAYLHFQGSVYASYIEYTFEQLVIQYGIERQEKQKQAEVEPVKEVDVKSLDDSDDLPF